MEHRNAVLQLAAVVALMCTGCLDNSQVGSTAETDARSDGDGATTTVSDTGVADTADEPDHDVTNVAPDADIAVDAPVEVSIPDADGDGVRDTEDACRVGAAEWTSDGTTDHDADGCRDADEDADDDGDGVPDDSDACTRGTSSGADYDGDGCHDAEDVDDDEDGVIDEVDECAQGVTGWTSTIDVDADEDGCRDTDEDLDLDGDGIPNVEDPCPDFAAVVFPDVCEYFAECDEFEFGSMTFADVGIEVKHGEHVHIAVGERGTHLVVPPPRANAISIGDNRVVGPYGGVAGGGRDRVPWTAYWVGTQIVGSRLRERVDEPEGQRLYCRYTEFRVTQTTSEPVHAQFVLTENAADSYADAGLFSGGALTNQPQALRGHLARNVGEGGDIDGDGAVDPWGHDYWDASYIRNPSPDWLASQDVAAHGAAAFVLASPLDFDVRLGAHLGPYWTDKNQRPSFRVDVFVRGELVHHLTLSIGGNEFFDVGTIKATTAEFVPRYRCHGTESSTCEADADCQFGLACDSPHVFEIPEEYRNAYP